MSIEEFAKQHTGNWMTKDFSGFAWNYEPEDSDNWMITMLRTRDSGFKQRYRADWLLEKMHPAHSPDWLHIRSKHFGFGWIEWLAVRVRNDDEGYTQAFEKVFWAGGVEPCNTKEFYQHQKEEFIQIIRGSGLPFDANLVFNHIQKFWPEELMYNEDSAPFLDDKFIFKMGMELLRQEFEFEETIYFQAVEFLEDVEAIWRDEPLPEVGSDKHEAQANLNELLLKGVK